MTRGSDEVQTGVDARVMVGVQYPADLQLLLQVVFKLCVDVVDDGPVTTDSSVTRRQTAQPQPRARSPAERPTSLLSVRTNSFCLGIPAWVQVADPFSWSPSGASGP